MNTSKSSSWTPLILFFGLVILLSVPLWVIGGSGGNKLVADIPVTGLMALCPLIAALILTAWQGGWRGLGGLIARTWDAGEVNPDAWYVPIVMFNIVVAVLAYFILNRIGVDLAPLRVDPLRAATLLPLFMLGGLAEELGWTGYLTAPLRQRLGPLGAGLAIGVFWAAWHAVPYVQTGWPLDWIAAQFIVWVCLRVMMMWLYDAAGPSVFAAALFHAMITLTFFQFPKDGSSYDPKVTAVLIGVSTLVAIAGWQPWRRADD